jgi:UPF0176 protein
MIFKKGKSKDLKFKKSGDLPDAALAVFKKQKPIRQRISEKKVLIGKGEHYYTKSKIGLFVLDRNELKVGDKILVSGPTTGVQELILEEMYVNGKLAKIANAGDKVTLSLPFRIRNSDKLFKVIQ